MGKDINGKELGKGITQRNDGRYNARVTINGVKINLYDYNLSLLKKNLEAKKEWINELNVFPVPDGDTGTNMSILPDLI